MLVRLIYSSRAPEGGLEEKDLKSILEASRRENQRIGVTGMLTSSNAYFLQCLEGSCKAVNDLYNYIVRDTRHEHIRLVAYEEIDERDFANWPMGYASVNSTMNEMVLKYSGSETFDPFSMSSDSARKLLVELSQVAE